MKIKQMNLPKTSEGAIPWAEKKQQLITRLKRVEGQVRAVQGLIAEEDDCEKIAQQLAAARKALDRSFYDLIACMMERQLQAEVSPARHQPQMANAAIAEFTRLLARYG